MTRAVVAAVDDFFFQTKIKEAARAAGVEVLFAPSVEGALEAVAARGATLLIIDLASGAFRPADLLRAASADPAARPALTVGYLPHVRDDLRKEAEEAGCKLVLARSAFVKKLPGLLAESGGAKG